MSAISWTQTPTTKKITLPSGNSYWLEDNEVRAWIGDGSTSGAEKRLSDAESAIAALSNATHWLGITTTALTDGSTTNPVTINSKSVTAVSGDIVQYSDKEFIFNGTAWQQFGESIGVLKAFAYVDEGEVTIQPAGTNAASSVSFGTPSSDTFVKSYPGSTKKLATTSITPVGEAGTAPSWSATVTDGVMTFSWSAGTTPYTAGTAVTVATGSVASSDDHGSDVMVGLGNATTAYAVTAMPTATAAAQTFTGTSATHTVTPKLSNS